MKKCISVILFGAFLSACASMKTFNDPNVSIYLGRFERATDRYFHVNKESGFYMIDDGGTCEIGQCRISQDTLYCYPRLNKSRNKATFLVDSASSFYVDTSIPNEFLPVYETKYLLKDNRLYFLTEIESNFQISSNVFFVSLDDAFYEKIDIKDDPKYRKKVLPPM